MENIFCIFGKNYLTAENIEIRVKRHVMRRAVLAGTASRLIQNDRKETTTKRILGRYV